jgi:uncharacterized membrane protein YgdD (TMEM256/DUF423 family)
MRRLALVAAVAAALAAPSAASAGGMGAFALHGPQKSIKAGDVWLAQLRVVGCVGTPMDAVPTVAISNASGERLTFRGRKTAGEGRYLARVVFPTAGEWSYEVSALGTVLDRKGPFAVSPAARPPSRLLSALPPVGAVLLVLGTGLALRRRRA